MHNAQEILLLHEMAKLLAFTVGTILLLALITGLWVWYGPRWRYYKRATSMVQILLFGGSGVTDWIFRSDKYRLFPILCILACIFPVCELIKEFRQPKTIVELHPTSATRTGKG
jgi:hypothetical protein